MGNVRRLGIFWVFMSQKAAMVMPETTHSVIKVSIIFDSSV
jgi:hypothetical protein